MIELPRAALVADEIAKEAEFFSFGTNDLTQNHVSDSRATTSTKSCRPTLKKAFSNATRLKCSIRKA